VGRRCRRADPGRARHLSDPLDLRQIGPRAVQGAGGLDGLGEIPSKFGAHGPANPALSSGTLSRASGQTSQRPCRQAASGALIHQRVSEIRNVAAVAISMTADPAITGQHLLAANLDVAPE
jgi:hypothetical protein